MMAMLMDGFLPRVMIGLGILPQAGESKMVDYESLVAGMVRLL